MKIILKKTKLQKYHWFYIGFFVLFALFEYLFLYRLTGLQLFQTNIHFFSNVIGSFSKRFIADAAPLALFLYLAFYTKKKGLKKIYLGLFAAIFTLNVLTVSYYYIYRSNWLPGQLSFDPLTILTVILTLGIGLGFGYFASKTAQAEAVWPVKRNMFIAGLILLSLLSPFIPIRYSAHRTLLTTQEDVEKFFRVVHLEKSSLTHLTQVLTGTSKPIVVPDVSVFGNFKEEVELK